MMFAKAVVTKETSKETFFEWVQGGITPKTIGRAVDFAPYVIEHSAVLEKVIFALEETVCSTEVKTGKSNSWIIKVNQILLLNVMTALLKATRAFGRNSLVKFTLAKLLENIVVVHKRLFRAFAEAFSIHNTERKLKLLNHEIQALGGCDLKKLLKNFIDSTPLNTNEFTIVSSIYNQVEDCIDDLSLLCQRSDDLTFMEEVTDNAEKIGDLYGSLSNLAVEGASLNEAEELLILIFMAKLRSCLNFCKDTINLSTNLESTKAIREEVTQIKKDIIDSFSQLGLVIKRNESGELTEFSYLEMVALIEKFRESHGKAQTINLLRKVFTTHVVSYKEKCLFLHHLQLQRQNLSDLADLMQESQVLEVLLDRHFTKEAGEFDCTLLEFITRQPPSDKESFQVIILKTKFEKLETPHTTRDSFRSKFTKASVEHSETPLCYEKSPNTVKAESTEYFDLLFNNNLEGVSPQALLDILEKFQKQSVWVIIAVMFAPVLCKLHTKQIPANLLKLCKVNNIKSKYEKVFHIAGAPSRFKISVEGEKAAIEESLDILDVFLMHLLICGLPKASLQAVFYSFMESKTTAPQIESKSMENRWAFYHILYCGLHSYLIKEMKDHPEDSLFGLGDKLEELAKLYIFRPEVSHNNKSNDAAIAGLQSCYLDLIGQSIHHLEAAQNQLSLISAIQRFPGTQEKIAKIESLLKEVRQLTILN